MLEMPRTVHFDDCADSIDPAILAATVAAAPALPEAVDLEFPGWIWGSMFGCYGLFFAGLIAATGHNAEAVFMLVISVGYALMYFGTAAVLFGVNRPRLPSKFARGLAPLQTWTGPMDSVAVAAQVLTVPACLALFGIAAAIIRTVILG